MSQEAEMQTKTAKLNRVRGGLGVLGLLALLPLQLACDDGPVPPGSEGCEFDTSLVDGSTVAVMEITGGLAGAADRYVIRDDGTLTHFQLADDVTEERAVPGGEERAAQLIADLDATHVEDIDSGCYQADEEVPDGLDVRLIVQLGGRQSFFGSECESGPSELTQAIALLEAYVLEAR
jgi:hypothetical protein